MMILYVKQNNILLYFILLILICNINAACSKNIKRSEDINANMSQKDGDSIYLKEGFVSKDLYRIVIVEPKEITDSYNREKTEKTAKRRALISLQKYIMSNNQVINKNINAILLNLIEEHGILRTLPTNHRTRNIHLFEIRKSALKQSLEDLAENR